VAHAEGVPPGEQNGRDDPGDDRLLEVEALEEVEHAQGDHQRDG